MKFRPKLTSFILFLICVNHFLVRTDRNICDHAIAIDFIDIFIKRTIEGIFFNHPAAG